MEDEVFWGSRWLGSLPLFDERGPRRVTAVDPERKTQRLHSAALDFHRWAANCLIHSLGAGSDIQKGMKAYRHQPPSRRCGSARRRKEHVRADCDTTSQGARRRRGRRPTQMVWCVCVVFFGALPMSRMPCHVPMSPMFHKPPSPKFQKSLPSPHAIHTLSHMAGPPLWLWLAKPCRPTGLWSLAAFSCANHTPIRCGGSPENLEEGQQTSQLAL